MMPITKFLSCTDPLEQFESLSYHQTQHAKPPSQVLLRPATRPVTGIAREVLPANSGRALNKFLAEYDQDEDQLNHERLEELQKHGETRWAQDGYIIVDDTINQKPGDEVPGVGHFYDHAESDTVWGQNIVYAFYADEKTAYPLAFRLYEDGDSKLDLAREIIAELEEEVGARSDSEKFWDHYRNIYRKLVSSTSSTRSASN